MIIVENNTLSIRPPHSFLNYIVVTELLQTGAYKTITKPTERVRSSDKEKKTWNLFPRLYKVRIISWGSQILVRSTKVER